MSGKNFQHIEFLGGHGSGKSYLHNSSQKYLEKKYNRKFSGLKKSVELSLYSSVLRKNFGSQIGGKALWYWHKISGERIDAYSRFAAENKELIDIVSEGIQQLSRNRYERKRGFSKLARLSSEYQIISENFNGDLFVDEGFAFRAVDFFSNQQKILENKIKKYSEVMPIPDLIIYIDASTEERLKALQTRNSGFPPRMRRLNSEEKIKFIENSGKCCEIIKDSVKNQTNVIEVKNTFDQNTESCLYSNLLSNLGSQ